MARFLYSNQLIIFHLQGSIANQKKQFHQEVYVLAVSLLLV